MTFYLYERPRNKNFFAYPVISFYNKSQKVFRAYLNRAAEIELGLLPPARLNLFYDPEELKIGIGVVRKRKQKKYRRIQFSSTHIVSKCGHRGSSISMNGFIKYFSIDKNMLHLKQFKLTKNNGIVVFKLNNPIKIPESN